jgi:PadR family transcriptional regulator PadR
MKNYLGEFEELVLLTIAMLGDDAYGVSIKEAIEERANRNITVGSLHSTITRLEEKGFITSYLGGATALRGGRKKRFFHLNDDAREVLAHIKSLRDELWSLGNLGTQSI